MKNNKLDVIILGAGGHAEVAADIIMDGKENLSRYQLIGFLDDKPELFGSEVLDLPVLGSMDQLDQIPHDAIYIGIGNNQKRQELFNLLSAQNQKIINAIHRSAIISSHARLGKGIFINAGVIINSGSVIGDNVILNTSSSIGHHSLVENHAHVGPGVTLGGGVTVCEGTMIGAGSTVIPQSTIGKWSVVGAGACVISDIPAGEIVAGVPAKSIKMK